MVEIGNERSREEEYNVEHKPNNHVEPKDGVILFVRRLLLIGQRSGEAALLKHTCDIGEDDQRRHLAVVLWIEDVE